MTKIFFGCSMRGGYDKLDKDELAKIPELIEDLGYKLASKHQTQDWEDSEEDLTKTHIHDRDYQWLQESDIGIFEISNPSLGVGGEVSDMLYLGKPVLCIYSDKLHKDDISAYTQGKKGSKFVDSPFEVCSYTDLKDLKGKIEIFVEEYKQS